MNSSKVSAALFINVILLLLGPFAFGQSEGSSLVVQSAQTVTKGFPCILKMEFNSTGKAPAASLYDEHSSLLFVHLVSRTNNAMYKVLSGINGVGDDEDECRRANWQLMVDVMKNRKRTSLVDLASLRVEKSPLEGEVLVNVPPGEYDAEVIWTWVRPPKAQFRVKIVAPTPDEERVLSKIQKSVGGEPSRIDWCRILGSGTSFPRDAWEQLSPTTKEQTAFHRLLMDLNAAKTLGTNDLNTIATAPLPKFLEPERECLLYEVKVAMGMDDEAEAARLTKKYPDLEWRVRDIQTNKVNFLRRKSPTADKGK